MHLLLTVLLLLLLQRHFLIAFAGGFESVTEQTCHSGWWAPRCASGQMLLVESAEYGRMRMTRCIQKDFGYLGCSNNVTSTVARVCSGRVECKLHVLDSEFSNVRICHNDLKSYLDVTYKCVRIFVPPEDCRSRTGEVLVPVNTSRQFLSSVTSRQSGCGDVESPYRLEARHGQRIDVSLLDFSHSENRSDPSMAAEMATGSCRVYATIRELGRNRSETICGDAALRRHVYKSSGHSVEVRLLSSPSGQQRPLLFFFFEYVAHGCATLAEPSHGWVKQNRRVATLGCRLSDNEWQLTCISGTWQGRMGNCSATLKHELDGSATSDPFFGILALSMEVSVIIIVVLALSIGLLVLILGLLCLRRHQSFGRSSVSRHASICALGPEHGKSSSPSITRVAIASPRRATSQRNVLDGEYATMRLLHALPDSATYEHDGASHRGVQRDCPCSKAYSQGLLTADLYNHAVASYLDVDPDVVRYHGRSVRPHLCSPTSQACTSLASIPSRPRRALSATLPRQPRSSGDRAPSNDNVQQEVPVPVRSDSVSSPVQQ